MLLGVVLVDARSLTILKAFHGILLLISCQLARRRAIYRQLQAAARGALPLGAVELVVTSEVWP